MQGLAIGVILRNKRYPGLTWKVTKLNATMVELEKLTEDANRPKGPANVRVGALRTVEHKVLSHYEIVFKPNQSVHFEIAPDAFKSTNVAPIEFGKAPNQCGCDCGGWKTYQSIDKMFHSDWCFVLTQKRGA